MRKKKKIFIMLLLIIVLIFVFIINFERKEVKREVSAKKEIIKEEKTDDEEVEENSDDQKLNENDSIKKEQIESNNNSVNSSSNNNENESTNSTNKSSSTNTQSNQSSSNSNNQISSSTSSNNNSQASTSRTDDKTVDTSHPEYYIHQGKRDCTDSLDCMDISLPIQFKYKRVIANTYYVEVIAKDGTVLGYFIEYVFKDYTYSSDEECNQVGNEIKSTLSDRVTGFSCNSGNLKIITNY